MIHNLNREIDKMQAKGYLGLYNAANLIRRDMDQTEPLIPVDTNTLRSSWSVAKIPPDLKGMIGVLIGFTANYAFLVHEDMERKFHRPGSGPKFFEASLKRNKDKVLDEIKKAVQIDRGL